MKPPERLINTRVSATSGETLLAMSKTFLHTVYSNSLRSIWFINRNMYLGFSEAYESLLLNWIRRSRLAAQSVSMQGPASAKVHWISSIGNDGLASSLCLLQEEEPRGTKFHRRLQRSIPEEERVVKRREKCWRQIIIFVPPGGIGWTLQQSQVSS